MIVGVVRAGEARVLLKIRGPRQQEQEIDAIIDTGYNGSLTLPPALITSLGLIKYSVGSGMLADGSKCLFDVFQCDVAWDRQVRRILIDETDAEPMVGMGLLTGYELKIQVRPNGRVSITQLRHRRGY